MFICFNNEPIAVLRIYPIDMLWFFNIYLFWLHRVLVAACGIFSCGMQNLSCGMHAGSNSLTRDRTRAPCIGSTESYPLGTPGKSRSYRHVFANVCVYCKETESKLFFIMSEWLDKSR